MKEIRYSKRALRVLRRIPSPTARRIRDKIADYAENPASQQANIKALKGRQGIRLRVGDWRVIMDEKGNVLDVLDIGARGSVYE